MLKDLRSKQVGADLVSPVAFAVLDVWGFPAKATVRASVLHHHIPYVSSFKDACPITGILDVNLEGNP